MQFIGADMGGRETILLSPFQRTSGRTIKKGILSNINTYKILELFKSTLFIVLSSRLLSKNFKM
jgi:hypothetical protein